MKMTGQPGRVMYHRVQNAGCIDDTGQSAKNKKYKSADQVSKKIPAGIQVGQFSKKTQQSPGSSFLAGILQRGRQRKCRNKTGNGNPECQQTLKHFNASRNGRITELMMNTDRNG